MRLRRKGGPVLGREINALRQRGWGFAPFLWLVLVLVCCRVRLWAQAPPPADPVLRCASCDAGPLRLRLAAPQSSQPDFRLLPLWTTAAPSAQARPLPGPGFSAAATPLARLTWIASSADDASLRTQDSAAEHDSTQPRKKKPVQHSPSATAGSPGHIFWVVPAFKVEYGQNFKPLTNKEKFQEWARAAYDPLGLGTGAVEAATLEHSATDGFCGYGGGFSGYGKCFGSLELDANVSSFIGDFALTALLHQDPRYFRLGQGSFGRRLWYAVSRVFVTYNDSGRTVFYTSALSGTAIAAAVSNLYYPSQDVGFSHTMSRIAIDLGNTALYNGAAEFWPDFHRGLHRLFRRRSSP